MWRFNHFKNIVSLFLIFGFTTGCWKAEKHNDSQNSIKTQSLEDLDNSADFILISAQGEATPTKEVTKDWKIEMARYYNFRACIISRASRDKLIGIPMRVSIAGKNYDDVTQSDGCFQWQERIPVVNYFGQSQYLVLERTIEGTGVYKGSRRLKLAVNPWAGFHGTGDKEVIWLRTGSEIPESIRVVDANEVDQLLKGSEKQTYSLWMKNVKALVKQVKELDKGVVVELNLEMNPIVKRYTASGAPSPYALKAGKFRVFAQIVASNIGLNRDESLILTPDVPPSIGTIEEGDQTLRTTLHAQMSRRVARGNLQLVLRVEPIGGPVGLKDFSGLYELGSYAKLEGSHGLYVSPKVYAEGSEFNYNEHLKKSSNYDKLLSSFQAFKLDPFEFKTMTIKFETIKPGETSTTRTVEYSIEVCAKNTLSGDMIRDELFYVDHIPDHRYEGYEREFYGRQLNRNIRWCEVGEDPGNPKKCQPIPRTNHEGCLNLIGNVTHKYYKPEELLFPKIKITHVASNFTKELTLAINPWDLFATFGRDRRVLTDDYIQSLLSREKIPSLFFIHQFSYYTLRFRYEIDEFMNLVVKKMLLFRADPYVLRYSSIVNGRRATEALRDGIYLLKLAVQKDYLDPAAKGVTIERDQYSGQTKILWSEHTKTKQYITAIKKLVRVQDGKIITPVEIAMRDLRLMRIRSNMLLQLETIDEKELTKINIFHEELSELAKQRETNDVGELKKFMQKKMAPINAYVKKLSETPSNKEVVKFDPKVISNLYEEMDETADLPQDFIAKVMDKTTDAYRKNDLTYMSTAPVIDMDMLRDKDSGLEPRVFTGPVTLLLNSNSSFVRPVDNLDEVFCPMSDDCDRIKHELSEKRNDQSPRESQEYLNSPLFGSVKHLYRISVDDFIKKMLVLEQRYKALSHASSVMYSLVNTLNLTYTSLEETEPLKKYDAKSCPSIDDFSKNPQSCLKPTTESQISFKDFITQFNQTNFRKTNFDKSDFANVIQTGKISRELEEQLCSIYSEKIYEIIKNDRVRDPVFLNKGIAPYRETFLKCLAWQSKNRTSEGVEPPALVLDRKMKVYQTGEYRFKGGKSMNLNVGDNVNLNFNDSRSTGHSFNFIGVISSLLREIPIIGGIVSGLTVRDAHDRTKSKSGQVSISQQAFLVMQQATMDVEILSHEKCIILKMNSSFLTESLKGHVRFDVDSLSEEDPRSQMINQSLKGNILCEGKPNHTPEGVRERYYYFTQHFTEGDQLDSSDIYNHPWLLALRGRRDFESFVGLIKAVPFNWDLTAVVKEEGWALDQMMTTYRAVTPTLPGLYTMLPREELPEFPFDDTPRDSFKESWQRQNQNNDGQNSVASPQ